MSASPRSSRSNVRHRTVDSSSRSLASPSGARNSQSPIASPGRVGVASPRSPGGGRRGRQDGPSPRSPGASPRMSPRTGPGRRERMGELAMGKTDSDFLDEAMERDEAKRNKSTMFSFLSDKEQKKKDDDELSDLPSEDSEEEKRKRGPRRAVCIECWIGCCSKCCSCIRISTRICTYLGIILFDFISCDWRRRRRIRKFNSWINLGDREARLNITRAKKKDFVEKANDELRSRGYRAWRINLLSTAIWLARSYADLKLLMMELFGRVDKKTGLPASVLEQWQLVKLVHTGRHGYVYEAVGQTKKHRERTAIVKLRDKSMGQVFNISYQRSMKVLKSHVIVRDRNILLRLLARWRIFSADFYNVCLAETYAVFDSSEFFVEVMEKFSHGSVHEYLEHLGQQLDEHAACAIFKRIVKGLEYLHHHRIIHRDVRTQQILIPKAIKKNGLSEVRLGDLWCMARLPRKSPLVEKDVPLFVAVHAPEVVTEGIWTDKADMWSVGCMLFELLYGHLPFGGHGKALIQRICTQPPEYDHLATQPSALALDLFKGLFKRDFHRRFSARHALHHDWVHEFSEDRPEMSALREARRIRRVKLIGKPAFRRGMPAENLLAAKTGMFNAGWCSYMGSTSCALDFELGAGERRYWVTEVTASLWATADNPREIIMMATSRPDLTYSEVHKQRIESSSDLATTIEVDKPIKYTRVRFFRNFGGSYGIALRKLTFYGYEIRAVNIDVDYETVILTNGAAFWMHDEYIADTGKVHKSLKDSLEKGEPIPGSGARYRKYRDIHSGPSHTSTVLALFMPPLPPGLNIIAASLNLQYVCWAMHNQTPPRLKVMLETEFGERIKLFQTSDLAPSEHEPDSIVIFGYDCLPIMYSDPLNIPTEFSISIEVHCENNAGFLHLPRDFGLTFYYLPAATTPSDSEEEEAEKERQKAEKASKKKRKGTQKGEEIEDALEEVEQGGRSSLRGSIRASKRNSIISVGGMSEMTLEDYGGSDYGGYEEELELREDYMYLENRATYGGIGQPAFERDELPSWQPADMPVDDDGLAKEKTDKSWMDVEAGRSADTGLNYSSGTVQQAGTSQTTADTLLPRAASRNRLSTKIGTKDFDGGDSPNNSDDEEKELDDHDLEELKIKTAFACEEARTRIRSEIETRATLRAVRAQSRYTHANLSLKSRHNNIFSTLIEGDTAQCIDSLRASPMGQHCQPAIQVIEGCSGNDVPKAFQACIPVQASRHPNTTGAEPDDLGSFPEESGESEQLETDHLEIDQPSSRSKDGCTLQ